MASDQGQYTRIATSVTTVLNSRPIGGVLRQIVINAPGTGWTITVFDNTAASGATIAVITPTAPATLEYDLQYTQGLTILTAGATPGDITVVYT